MSILQLSNLIHTFTQFAHSPSRTVMLILIFNSTAYCHAHSLILYILYSVLLYLIFYSFYFMHTSLVLYSTIFALSMERTWFTFHCWLYNLCIVVYVTNKAWKLETWKLIHPFAHQLFWSPIFIFLSTKPRLSQSYKVHLEWKKFALKMKPHITAHAPKTALVRKHH